LIFPTITPDLLDHGMEQRLGIDVVEEAQDVMLQAGLALTVSCYELEFGDPSVSGDWRHRKQRNTQDVLIVSVRAAPGTPYEMIQNGQEALIRAVFAGTFQAGDYTVAYYIKPLTTTSTTTTTFTTTTPIRRVRSKGETSDTTIYIGIASAALIIIALAFGVCFGVGKTSLKAGDIVAASDLRAHRSTSKSGNDDAALYFSGGLHIFGKSNGGPNDMYGGGGGRRSAHTEYAAAGNGRRSMSPGSAAYAVGGGGGRQSMSPSSGTYAVGGGGDGGAGRRSMSPGSGAYAASAGGHRSMSPSSAAYNHTNNHRTDNNNRGSPLSSYALGGVMSEDYQFAEPYAVMSNQDGNGLAAMLGTRPPTRWTNDEYAPYAVPGIITTNPLHSGRQSAAPLPVRLGGNGGIVGGYGSPTIPTPYAAPGAKEPWLDRYHTDANLDDIAFGHLVDAVWDGDDNNNHVLGGTILGMDGADKAFMTEMMRYSPPPTSPVGESGYLDTRPGTVLATAVAANDEYFAVGEIASPPSSPLLPHQLYQPLRTGVDRHQLAAERLMAEGKFKEARVLLDRAIPMFASIPRDAPQPSTSHLMPGSANQITRLGGGDIDPAPDRNNRALSQKEMHQSQQQKKKVRGPAIVASRKSTSKATSTPIRLGHPPAATLPVHGGVTFADSMFASSKGSGNQEFDSVQEELMLAALDSPRHGARFRNDVWARCY
jgi:hypothetical protein